MRTAIHLIFAATLLFADCGKDHSESANDGAEGAEGKTAYDAALAERLGADEYGMRNYVLALLKAGPNRNQDSLAAARLQQAHLENIQKLGEEGKLVLAGPFMDDAEIRGIYIFDTASIEEAQAWTETDPAIRAGRLAMELHPWYGSAALKMVNRMHETVAKKAL